ncbi:LysR substrate-binding domain-containing protein [Cupriavidus lacunae]|nr:LysR substrate-binding domain-containing protein [Cupriavidus lacunae]
MLTKLKSKQLEVFRAVILAGGASAAARTLNISQSLVSQQIAALETAVDFKLFERERGRLVPTRQGRAFFHEVDRHYVSMEALERRAMSLRGAQEDQIYVGCQHALGYTLLPSVIRIFRQSHPSVRVSLQIANSGEIKDRVSNGDWDIGFAASEIDTSGVVHSIFSKSAAVVITPLKHTLARKRGTVTLEELASFPLVALNSEDVTRKALEKACTDRGLQLQFAVETPYSMGVLAMVREGIGIGIVNAISLSHEARRQVAVLPLEVEIRFSTLAVFPPSSPSSPRVREVLKIARTELAKMTLPGTS